MKILNNQLMKITLAFFCYFGLTQVAMSETITRDGVTYTVVENGRLSGNYDGNIAVAPGGTVSIVDDVTIQGSLLHTGNSLSVGGHLNISGDFLVEADTYNQYQVHMPSEGSQITVGGDLIQSLYGVVSLGQGRLDVLGDYLHQDNANLQMKFDSSSLTIDGSLIKSSLTDTLGTIIRGTIEFRGDVTFLNGGLATYSQTLINVILAGNSSQSIHLNKDVVNNFGNLHISNQSGELEFNIIPGGNWTYAGSVLELKSFDVINAWDTRFFHDLNIQLPAGQEAKVDSMISMGGEYSLTINGDVTLSKRGNISLAHEASIVITGNLNINTDLYFITSYGLNLSGGSHFLVQGDIIQSSGHLIIENAELVVNGDYRLQGSDSASEARSTGQIKMSGGKLLVQGDYVQQSYSNHNDLSAGELILNGGFKLISGDFETIGNHKITVSGSEEQIFETNGLGFDVAHLHVSNQFENFTIDAWPTGKVTFEDQVQGQRLQLKSFVIPSNKSMNLSVDLEVDLPSDEIAILKGSINLNGYKLIINGNVNSDINMNSNINNSLEASVSELTINGDYNGRLFTVGDVHMTVNGGYNGKLYASDVANITINGDLNGNLDVQGDAQAVINGDVNGGIAASNNSKVLVSGSITGLNETLITSDAGEVNVKGSVNGGLSMRHADSLVTIAGDYSSGDTTPYLLAGSLILEGDFLSGAVRSWADHKITLSGNNEKFFHSDTSYNGELYIDNQDNILDLNPLPANLLYTGSLIKLKSFNFDSASFQEFNLTHNIEVQDHDNETLVNIIRPISLNGKTLFIDGDVSVATNVNINIQEGELSVSGDLIQTQGSINILEGKLSVAGDLTQAGGKMALGGGELIIDGNYRIQAPIESTSNYTASAGTLEMINMNDSVVVGGDFVMDSQRAHAAYLTAGQIIVKGDFTQLSTRYSANFAAGQSHKVILAGSSDQDVSFASPEESQFGQLHITNQTGRINFDLVPSNLWTYNGETLKLGSLKASPYTQITHPINHWPPASYKFHPAPVNNLARYS